MESTQEAEAMNTPPDQPQIGKPILYVLQHFFISLHSWASLVDLEGPFPTLAPTANCLALMSASAVLPGRLPS